MSQISRQLPRRRPATRNPTGAPPYPEASAAATLEALYQSEHAKLMCYLRARVGHDAASDIAQEVFVRVAASPQLLHLINPGGYLCRIARNIVIDRARAQGRKAAAATEMEAVGMPLASQHDHGLAAIDFRLSLDRMVSKLPERTQRVFLMYCVEDMAYRDIHRALGITMGAVEYHMGRALAHVRGAVEGATSTGPHRPGQILRK